MDNHKYITETELNKYPIPPNNMNFEKMMANFSRAGELTEALRARLAANCPAGVQYKNGHFVMPNGKEYVFSFVADAMTYEMLCTKGSDDCWDEQERFDTDDDVVAKLGALAVENSN